jgi:hypothetical protein
VSRDFATALFVTEGTHRIDSGGAAGRHRTGAKGYEKQQDGGCNRNSRVVSLQFKQQRLG